MQLRVLVVALALASTAHAAVSILVGTIKDAQGNPINGTLVMRLPIPAQDPTTLTAIAPTPVTFSLVNGAVTGGAPLYDLATIQPSKLWYSARAYDTTGKLVFYANYYVSGGIFNIGAATPTTVTTSNISFSVLPVGSSGFVVPTNFSTISSAITAAAGAGNGPVTVLPTSTDNTTYTNANNVRLLNYKQKNGIDSGFFRDVSEWGKIDGTTIPCSNVSGSTLNSCAMTGGFTGFVSGSVSAGGDVGKLILIPDAGPITGQVMGTMTVVSGGTGGTPGLQGVIFNDAGDGCNTIDTMPYAYATVNGSGVPTGNLTFTGNFWGKGCTRPPTTGTVNTVTGTVTFSGGTMQNGDLVTTITGVNSPTQITLGTSATVPVNGVTSIYGQDVHNTFQTACNAMNSNASLKGGTLTFSGIGLTSTGIDCISPGLKIIGNGYEPLNSFGAGSTLIYAGNTTTAGQYVLNLAGGWGETIEGIGIRGNTVAKPYALKLTNNNTTPGNFGNTFGKVERTWLGWEWGDQYDSQLPMLPRLQSCVFSDGPNGNDDFWEFDRIYCIGADTGYDSNNNQATGYRWGSLQSEYDNVGFSFSGSPVVDQYFTEFNRVDIMSGSPYWSGGFPGSGVFHGYVGESSAKAFEPSPIGATFHSFNLFVNSGFLGSTIPNLTPDNISADFSALGGGTIQFAGGLPGKVLMSNAACSTDGSSSGYNVQLLGIPTTQMKFVGTWTNGCQNLAQGGKWTFDNTNFLTGEAYHTSIPTNQDFVQFGPFPLKLDTNNSQIHIGSLTVSPATSPGTGPIPGSYTQVVKVGTGGSTTYNYRVSCVDGAAANGGVGKETDAFTFTALTTGNATLNTTNYNVISFREHAGCQAYNLYGDQGSGALGLMTPSPVSIENIGSYNQAPFPNYSFFDQGQYTKNTSIPPPTFSNSGSLTVAGPSVLSGKLNIADKGTCTMASGTCAAQTLVASYTAAPTCFATYTGTGTLAGTIKISSTAGTASTAATVTPASTTGTDTAQVNWACLGN